MAQKCAAPELAGDVARAKRIADFLRDGQKKMPGGTSILARNIEVLLQSDFAGNIAALARFLSVNRYSVIAWKAGVHRPTLLALADLSIKVNVSMAELLVTQLGAADFTLQSVGDRQPSRRLFASPPKTDLVRMRRVLEEATKGEMFPAPSLNQLATRLTCNQSTIQRRFPELAEIIKSQHQRFAAIRIEIRSKLFRSIVHSTVMSIHQAGDYPSQWRVREMLPKFIDMREPVALQEWKQTLASLNC
jgi:DNA-binding transcriptional regulator YhcF (GntR family)